MCGSVLGVAAVTDSVRRYDDINRVFQRCPT